MMIRTIKYDKNLERSDLINEYITALKHDIYLYDFSYEELFLFSNFLKWYAFKYKVKKNFKKMFKGSDVNV